jgi:hypothetical protein
VSEARTRRCGSTCVCGGTLKYARSRGARIMLKRVPAVLVREPSLPRACRRQ